MSSNSQNEIDEQFLDTWLSEQNFPTNVPRQMKILTFAGHISFALKNNKKNVEDQKKNFQTMSDAQIFSDQQNRFYVSKVIRTFLRQR